MPCASPSWPTAASVSRGAYPLRAADTHIWSGCVHSLQSVPTVLISGSTVTSASRTGPRLSSATFPTSPSSGTRPQRRMKTLSWLRPRTTWTEKLFSARWTGSAGSTERALGCLVLRFLLASLVSGVTKGDPFPSFWVSPRAFLHGENTGSCPISIFWRSRFATVPLIASNMFRAWYLFLFYSPSLLRIFSCTLQLKQPRME